MSPTDELATVGLHIAIHDEPIIYGGSLLCSKVTSMWQKQFGDIIEWCCAYG